MRWYLTHIILICLLCCYASTALADNQKAAKRAKVLMGTPPVNVNIASSGTLPQGVLFTALNTSFADKNRSVRGGKGSDVFTQAWLLKVRYGITNNLEFATVGSYVNLDRTSPIGRPQHLEGFGDQSFGFGYAFMNGHQGDPCSLSVTASLLTPTAPRGNNHLPGSGVFGGRLTAAYGQFFTPDIKFDTELVWTGPFERGNQNVLRGDLYQWNAQLRYLFDNFDVAFESTLSHQESADKHFSSGSFLAGRYLTNGMTRDLRNGYTDWFVGPSMNVAFDAIDSWAGIGVFFPVMQHAAGPTKMEDARFEFKIGKLW